MIVTGNWADILNPSMRKIYDDVYNRFPEEYSKVFKLSTSDRNYEKFSSATGFGMAVDVDEGEEIPSDDQINWVVNKFSLINGNPKAKAMGIHSKQMFVHKKNIGRAYLAGLIDGDGSIFMCRSQRKKYNDQFILRVKVVTTDERTVSFITERFGGNVNKDKTLYDISWHCKEAQKLLSKIMDYLILKREQATVALRIKEPSSSKNIKTYTLLHGLNSNKDRVFYIPKMKQRLFWAYLAGLIDSDGHIRTKNNCPFIKITQRNICLLGAIRSKIGMGNIHTTRNWHDLEISNSGHVISILRKIEKLLICKQKIANIVIENYNTKMNKQYGSCRD